MAGKDAFGVSLERSEDGDSWEEVANIHSLSGPGLEREEYDVTTHMSPEQWEEIIFGIKRSGEVTADVYFDEEKHLVLLDDFNTSEPVHYRMGFKDGSRWSFKAGLTGFEPEFPHDGPAEASLTIKLSGKPNFDDAPDNGTGGGDNGGEEG